MSFNINQVLEKHTTTAPRYVAYPPPNHWCKPPPESAFANSIRRISSKSQSLELYVHIPFCSKLCWYCGCKTEIRPEKSLYGDTFLDSLSKEIDTIKDAAGRKLLVNSLHLGGGTPTYLNPTQINRLMKMLRSAFLFEKFSELSLESNPETVVEDRLKAMWENGFSRISYGIQDFNKKVQQAINRKHSFNEVRNLISRSREIGFESINLDLVYGLPFQKTESYMESIKQVIKLDPERIALFNFAYLPDKIPHQSMIKAKNLPSPVENCEMFLEASKLLNDATYAFIGMDHFVKQTDKLAQSSLNNSLSRNFMGYVSNQGDNLLGLGAGAISFLNYEYFRNAPSTKLWSHSLNENKRYKDLWYKQTHKEQKSHQLINELLCQKIIRLSNLAELFGAQLDLVTKKLDEFVKDLILDWNVKQKTWKLTDDGRLFSRVVAKAIDPLYLSQGSEHAYSKIA